VCFSFQPSGQWSEIVADDMFDGLVASRKFRLVQTHLGIELITYLPVA